MKRQNVLLLEDDAWLQEMYADSLEGVVVSLAASADEALEKLDEKTFDLIVLDMFLPGHNGIEFIHEIASYEDTADIPIIVLSAVSPDGFGLSQERMKQYNVVEYLYKPALKPSEVASRVRFHLREFVAK